MRSLVVALALVLAPGAALAGPWRSGAAGYERAIVEQKTSGAPAFVYFRTEWCGYCKKLDNGPLANRDVQDYLANFERIAVNPDNGGKDRALADKFGVKGYPSVYVVMPGGTPQKIQAFYDAKEGAKKFLAALKNVAGEVGTPAAAAANSSVVRPQGMGPLGVELLKAIPQEVIDLQEEGRHEEATARLTRALDRQAHGKETAPLYFARAISYRAEAKRVDAAEDLDQAVTEDPEFMEARLLLARTYMDLTLWDEAVTALNAALERVPTAEGHWLRAYALSQKGRSKESKADYAAACKLGKKEACAKK